MTNPVSGSSSTLYWNRISGLASGMDTESIVKKLMEAERIPLDKMNQRKDYLQWQRDAYREMNSLLLDLKNSAFDMKLQGTYLTKKAVSSDESVVTATAGSTAPQGIHTVVVKEIAQLKTVASSSKDKISKVIPTDGSTTLSTQFDITGTISFSLNGETFTYDTAQKSIYDVVNDINAKASELHVTASYDANLDRFFLNTTAGSTESITLTDGDGGFVGKYLQMTPDKYIKTDAAIVYNGIEISSTTNTLSVNGLNLTLNSAKPGTAISLNVMNDTDAVFDRIVQFVGKYNETIDKINAKLAEPKYRDYPPLTDAQREAMSESQIEKWEEKAKSGLLQRDPLLQGALYDMRSAFNKTVSGLATSMDSMYDLGFSTGSYETNGKIIINEAKLRTALEQNPDQVMKLFTNVDAADEKNSAKQGLAVRLYTSLGDALTKLTDKAGSPATIGTDTESFIGKALDQLNDDIGNFEDRLKMVEDRYWRQFTAMEQAIQRANMQSGWLMQQFGGGQN